MKTEILQDFPVPSIIFLIYMSKLFKKVIKTCFLITYLSFIDNLGFINLSNFIKKVEKAFEKVVGVVIEWKIQNAIIYDISITEVILFSKVH